jgi:hypothetical protein
VHHEPGRAQSRTACERELEAGGGALQHHGVTGGHVDEVRGVEEERHRQLVEPLAELGLRRGIGIGNGPAPRVRREDLECLGTAVVRALQGAL